MSDTHTAARNAMTGFIEQATATPGGLKVAGWAVALPDGTPPKRFQLRWGELDDAVQATRPRPDVARANGINDGVFGFQHLLPVTIDPASEWPALKVTAHWDDGRSLDLPMLRVAREAFDYARKQMQYQRDAESGAASVDVPTPELTKREADKYRAMYNHPGYRANPGAPHEARDFLAKYGVKPGDSIIDFGSGPGYASNFFHEQGLRVIAVDIAPNAMRDEFVGKFPLIVSAFWNLPAKLDADWGFCTDVMEHIPPDRVDDVLRVIASSVRGSVLFNISLRFDGCGAVIDEILHMSVHPRSWWATKLGEFWREVSFVRGKEDDWACWIVSDRKL